LVKGKKLENKKSVDEVKVNELSMEIYFPSAVYFVEKPEFIDSVNKVSEKYLEKTRKENQLNEIYPVYMSEGYAGDSDIKEFSKYVGETAWNILSSQGYDMANSVTTFSHMWTQEHHKHSLMEQHVHGHGSQIVGFYFLECPENCSRLLVHDPRPGKIQNNLPEADGNEATYGSNIINFQPKPGMLIFANSWLPHSFGRHTDDKPIKFVHFDITTNYAPANNASNNGATAEVI